jgi:hypothetical protein
MRAGEGGWGAASAAAVFTAEERERVREELVAARGATNAGRRSTC